MDRKGTLTLPLNRENLPLHVDAGNVNLNVKYSDKNLVLLTDVEAVADQISLRVEMNGIILCVEGRSQFELGGEVLTLKKGQLMAFPSNANLQNCLFSTDFKCMGMGISNLLLQNFLGKHILLWNKAMYISKCYVLDMEERDMEFFRRFYELLMFCMEQQPEPEGSVTRSDIIFPILNGALNGFCSMFERYIHEKGSREQRSSTEIFQNFLQLLNGTEMKKQKLEYFAEKLLISPKYLSRICTQVSGKSAAEWVRQYVNEDIRYYLCSTSYSIKEISTMIGFPNTSFFSKYVRQHFGMSPLQLRLS